MPLIEKNFDDDVIELISDGVIDNEYFDPTIGHYIRMSVFNSDDELVRTYKSNQFWDGTPIYYGAADGTPTTDTLESYLPYTSETTQDLTTQIYFTGDPACDDYPGQCNGHNIELPLFFDTNGNVFIKANDVLGNDQERTFTEGKYTLKFDFLDNVFQGTSTLQEYIDPRFYLREISNSKKEVRLLARHTSGGDGSAILNMTDGTEAGAPPNVIGELTTALTLDDGSYAANFVLLLPNSVNHTIINYAFDKVSDDYNSLVIRFNKALPSISLYTELDIAREVYSTQTQTIIYFPDQYGQEGITYLQKGTFNSELGNDSDTLESYNDLVGSGSFTYNQKADILNSIFSSSYDVLNVDYSLTENSTFFGSQEMKLRNFYTKVKNIEDTLNSISSSFNVTSSEVSKYRKDLFNEIDTIVQDFTPYEHWLYSDYQSTASYPNAGQNFAQLPPVSGNFDDNYNKIDGNAEVLVDTDGIDIIYKLNSAGHDTILSGSYVVGAGDDSDFGIYEYWVTASNSENWYIDNEKAVFTASDPGDQRYFYQDSPHGNISQFSSSTSYTIEFDVDGHYSNGRLSFKFGPTNPNSHNFDIDSTGHYKKTVFNSGPEGGYGVGNNFLQIYGQAAEDGLTYLSCSVDNLTIRENQDEDGRIDYFTDKYKVENYPMSHYNGPFYLSFLAKWQELPTWENYNASSSLFRTPAGAFNSRYISSPTPSTESFQRYVLAASQSYWRPASAINDGSELSISDANDLTKWEILSGSNVSSSVGLTEVYNIDDAYGIYGDYKAYVSHSILPTGELFRLYQVTSSVNTEVAPITSSFITDVSIHKYDSLYDGDVTDTLWFSNLYSTSSNAVQEWYGQQLATASKYDSENIHSLYNNLPKHIRDNDTNELMKKFLALLGEHYDVLKQYIDNYQSIQSRDYDKNKFVPGKLIGYIGENLGWEFLNSESLKDLIKYYVGDQAIGATYKDLTENIWRNILNNIIYLYKTKGTEASIRGLMSSFGIPPNIITLSEVGGSFDNQIRSSPGLVDLLECKSLRKTQGSVAFDEYDTIFSFLNFGRDNHSITYDWNTLDTGLTTGVEFMFSSISTTANLLESSASLSESLWDVQLIQESAETSELQFQLNISPSGSLQLDTNAVSMSISGLPIKDTTNTKLWHFMLQRTQGTPTASYQMIVGSRFDDSGTLTDAIQYYGSASMEVTGAVANTNFIGTGSLVSTAASNNLYVGQNFSGSLGEFRVWNNAISESNFQTHIFDPKSIVGSNIESFNNVVYRYTYDTPNIKASNESVDLNSGNQYGDFSKDLPSTFTNPSISKRKLQIFQFSTRYASAIDTINTNKITIEKNTTPLMNKLSAQTPTFYSDDLDDQGYRKRFTYPKLKLSISPSQQMNRFVQSHISDKDLSNYLFNREYLERGWWDRPSNYPKLKRLHDSIFKNYRSTIGDLNKYVRRIGAILPKDLWKVFKNILPVSIDMTGIGIEIGNTIVYRNRAQTSFDRMLTTKNPGAESGVFDHNAWNKDIQQERDILIPPISSFMNSVLANDVEVSLSNSVNMINQSTLHNSLSDTIDILEPEKFFTELISGYQAIIDENITELSSLDAKINLFNDAIAYTNHTHISEAVVNQYKISNVINLSDELDLKLFYNPNKYSSLLTMLDSDDALISLDNTKIINNVSAELDINLVEDLESLLCNIFEAEPFVKLSNFIAMMGDNHISVDDLVKFYNDTITTDELRQVTANLNNSKNAELLFGIEKLVDRLSDNVSSEYIKFLSPNTIKKLPSDKFIAIIFTLLTNSNIIHKRNLKPISEFIASITHYNIIKKIEERDLVVVLNTFMTPNVLNKLEDSDITVLLKEWLTSNVIKKLPDVDLNVTFNKFLTPNVIEKLPDVDLTVLLIEFINSNVIKKLPDIDFEASLNTKINGNPIQLLDYNHSDDTFTTLNTVSEPRGTIQLVSTSSADYTGKNVSIRDATGYTWKLVYKDGTGDSGVAEPSGHFPVTENSVEGIVVQLSGGSALNVFAAQTSVALQKINAINASSASFGTGSMDGGNVISYLPLESSYAAGKITFKQNYRHIEGSDSYFVDNTPITTNATSSQMTVSGFSGGQSAEYTRDKVNSRNFIVEYKKYMSDMIEVLPDLLKRIFMDDRFESIKSEDIDLANEIYDVIANMKNYYEAPPLQKISEENFTAVKNQWISNYRDKVYPDYSPIAGARASQSFVFKDSDRTEYWHRGISLQDAYTDKITTYVFTTGSAADHGEILPSGLVRVDLGLNSTQDIAKQFFTAITGSVNSGSNFSHKWALARVSVTQSFVGDKGNSPIISYRYTSSVEDMEQFASDDGIPYTPVGGHIGTGVISFGQETGIGSHFGGGSDTSPSVDMGGGQELGWLSEGSVESLTEDHVNSKVFNHENRKKYLTNENTNYYVQGWRGDIEDKLIGTSSHKETRCMGLHIGDTEYIHMISASGLSYRTKIQGNGWVEGDTDAVMSDGVEYYDWDPTDSRIFRGNRRDPATGNPLGRTARIDIDWTTGEITYPVNHIKHGKARLWGGSFIDRLYKGTHWNGFKTTWDVPDDPDNKYKEEEFIPQDLSGQFEPISSVVQTKEVEPGKSKLRLKVERRDDKKGK